MAKYVVMFFIFVSILIGIPFISPKIGSSLNRLNSRPLTGQEALILASMVISTAA